ncbi:MAG: hypothetical protein D6714_15775 [Bacteroidetes bacterium]|nr:MAG: hypothetical protein D6714_15775 [Bacteroidota bacterium]
MNYAEKKWEQLEKSRRAKALVWAVAFHVLLLAGVVYFSEGNPQEKLPGFVKEWFHKNPPAAEKPPRA